MKKIRILIAVCACVIIVGTVAIAAVSNYDPSSDPIISLSYLKNVFKPEVVSEVVDTIKEEDIVSGSSSVAYTVEHLLKGQRIEATSSCEVILRSGRAEALVTSEENIANGVGLSNVTKGTEVQNGQEVPLNNYIIIPRADGRAVVVLSDDAYFMVRGEYTVVG